MYFLELMFSGGFSHFSLVLILVISTIFQLITGRHILHFYVDSAITYYVFLELLWDHSLYFYATSWVYFGLHKIKLLIFSHCCFSVILGPFLLSKMVYVLTLKVCPLEVLSVLLTSNITYVV